MKNSIASRKLTSLMAIALGIAVSAFVSASHALAQTNKAVVNIPFDFQTGNDHLKAGRYIVDMASDNILLLRNDKGGSMTLSRTEINLTPSATSKLVFYRHGNRRFLREVWQANKTEHQVLPESKAEKHIMIGENPTESNGIEVALLEPLK